MLSQEEVRKINILLALDKEYVKCGNCENYFNVFNTKHFFRNYFGLSKYSLLQNNFCLFCNAFHVEKMKDVIANEYNLMYCYSQMYVPFYSYEDYKEKMKGKHKPCPIVYKMGP